MSNDRVWKFIVWANQLIFGRTGADKGMFVETVLWKAGSKFLKSAINQ